MLKGKNFLLKRVISCVLVCAMILGLIPQSVYAAPSEGTDTQKTQTLRRLIRQTDSPLLTRKQVHGTIM